MDLVVESLSAMARESVSTYSDYGEEQGRGLFNYGFNVSTFTIGLTYVLGTMLLLSVGSLLLYYFVATAPTVTGRSSTGRDGFNGENCK